MRNQTRFCVCAATCPSATGMTMPKSGSTAGLIGAGTMSSVTSDTSDHRTDGLKGDAMRSRGSRR